MYWWIFIPVIFTVAKRMNIIYNSNAYQLMMHKQNLTYNPAPNFMHASRSRGPVWHALPAVLVFACAIGCCILAQLGLLLPGPASVSVRWVPIRWVLWSGLAWPITAHSFPHKVVGVLVLLRWVCNSPTESVSRSGSTLMEATSQFDMVHPLLWQSQLGTVA